MAPRRAAARGGGGGGAPTRPNIALAPPAPSPQIDEAVVEYRESILPELQAAHRAREAKEGELRDGELARLRRDVFGSEAALAAAAAAAAAADSGASEGAAPPAAADSGAGEAAPT